MFGLFNAVRRCVAALNGFAERIEDVNSEWDVRIDANAAGEIPDAITDRLTVDALANGHSPNGDETTEDEDGTKPKRKGRGSKAKS